MSKNPGLVTSALVGLVLVGSACGSSQPTEAAAPANQPAAATVEVAAQDISNEGWTPQGPWNDHLNDRCVDFDRTASAVVEAQHNMNAVSDLGQEAFVTQVAEFTSAADAAVAFDAVDMCHVPAAATQFLADIGVDAEIDFGGQQVSEVSSSGQFETWDMSDSGEPVGFAAVQQGNQVIVTITYDLGVDRALEESQSFVGSTIVQG